MDISTVGMTDYSSIISGSQHTDLEKNINAVKSVEEAKEAAKEFETYMVEQMFKQVMSTVRSDEEDSSGFLDYAYDLQAQKYAEMVSEQGKLGLANQLYEAMVRNMNIPNITVVDEEAASVAGTTEETKVQTPEV